MDLGLNVISGFRRDVAENCVLLDYYEERSSGNFFQRFRTTYRSHPQGLRSRTLRMGPIGCPETSVRNCHYSLRNNPEECSYGYSFSVFYWFD